MFSFTFPSVSRNLLILFLKIQEGKENSTKDLNAILIDTSAALDQTGENLADLNDDKGPKREIIIINHHLCNSYQQ